MTSEVRNRGFDLGCVNTHGLETFLDLLDVFEATAGLVEKRHDSLCSTVRKGRRAATNLQNTGRGAIDKLLNRGNAMRLPHARVRLCGAARALLDWCCQPFWDMGSCASNCSGPLREQWLAEVKREACLGAGYQLRCQTA